MTPTRFCELAERLAGERWRTRIGPMIHRSRQQVWKYSTGKCEVEATVLLVMELLLMKEAHNED